MASEYVDNDEFLLELEIASTHHDKRWFGEYVVAAQVEIAQKKLVFKQILGSCVLFLDNVPRWLDRYGARNNIALDPADLCYPITGITAVFMGTVAVNFWKLHQLDNKVQDYSDAVVVRDAKDQL